jgi:hypothetical protein
LNDCSDSDDDAAELHEANAAKTVADECLNQSAYSFSCDVHSDNCAGQALRRVTHIADPALMRNGRCRNPGIESEEECTDGSEEGHTECIFVWSHDGLLATASEACWALYSIARLRFGLRSTKMDQDCYREVSFKTALKMTPPDKERV